MNYDDYQNAKENERSVLSAYEAIDGYWLD
jgi:hypothetical protein